MRCTENYLHYRCVGNAGHLSPHHADRGREGVLLWTPEDVWMKAITAQRERDRRRARRVLAR